MYVIVMVADCGFLGIFFVSRFLLYDVVPIFFYLFFVLGEVEIWFTGAIAGGGKTGKYMSYICIFATIYNDKLWSRMRS